MIARHLMILKHIFFRSRQENGIMVDLLGRHGKDYGK